MRKTMFILTLSACVLLSGRSGAEWDEAAYPYPVPKGLQAPPVPADNPLTDAKVGLGKALYFDARLSADGTVSCATCHDPKQGWTDRSAVSTGIKGQKGGVSAPTVLNSAFMDRQFWDGRAPSLEEQAKGPIENPVEMGFTHAGAVERVKGIRGYRDLFVKAFGDDGVTIDRIAQAIAAFERTVLTGDAPYDRFEAGDATAMPAAAQRGLALFFGKAACSECHSGFNFSNSDFHNIGVGMAAKEPNLGRHAVTKQDKDRGAFKTPTLRNLADTAPYMHDGSQKTLEEVVDYYDRGGEANPWLDRRMKKLGLTAEEKKDLVSFLDALNGGKSDVEPPVLPK
jgi:cytochrome c peroxidase